MEIANVIAITAAAVCYRPAELIIKAVFFFSPLPLKEGIFWFLVLGVLGWFFIYLRPNGVRKLFCHKEWDLQVIGFGLVLVGWSKPLHDIVQALLTTTPPTLWEGLIILSLFVINCWWSWRLLLESLDQSRQQQLELKLEQRRQQWMRRQQQMQQRQIQWMQRLQELCGNRHGRRIPRFGKG